MKSQIDDIINFKYNSYCSNNINSTDYTDSKQNNCERRKINTKNMFEWDYVLDEKSTNTVENFIQASQFLNTTTKTFDSVYVITYDFHYTLTQTMLKLIDSSRNYKWILGDLEERDSRYWEFVNQ